MLPCNVLLTFCALAFSHCLQTPLPFSPFGVFTRWMGHPLAPFEPFLFLSPSQGRILYVIFFKQFDFH